MDCSLPGSSIYGIFQARVLEWGAIAFSIWLHRSQQIVENSSRHGNTRRYLSLRNLYAGQEATEPDME